MMDDHGENNISEQVQPLAADIGPATWQRPAPAPVKHHAPSFDGQSLLQSMFSVIIIALFVITFLVQAFVIPSESMEKTLLIGDYLLVNKVPFNNAGQPVRVRIWPSVDEERIRQKSPFGLRFRITNHDGFAALDSLHRYDCRI